MCRELLMKAEAEPSLGEKSMDGERWMEENRPAKGYTSLQGRGFSRSVCSAHHPAWGDPS